MTELSSSDGYHQNRYELSKKFLSIGKFLLNGLIIYGNCMAMRAPEVEAVPVEPITQIETENFAWRINSPEFDREFDLLVKQHHLD